MHSVTCEICPALVLPRENSEVRDNESLAVSSSVHRTSKKSTTRATGLYRQWYDAGVRQEIKAEQRMQPSPTSALRTGLVRGLSVQSPEAKWSSFLGGS